MKAQVNIRRGNDWIVKPEADKLDGRILELSWGWTIEEDDSSIYAGETAWIIDPKENTSLLWIASGDLTFIS